MARGETTSHEGLIHRMDELVDVAERQLLIHIGTSDTFEEAESLHLVLNRDLRDVEVDALICGKICRSARGTIVSTRSSSRRSCRSASCVRDWSSCSCCAGAAIAGTAERERRGIRSSKEGRLSVIKWSHLEVLRAQLYSSKSSLSSCTNPVSQLPMFM